MISKTKNVLEIQGLTKSYAGINVLSGVDFQLQRGEVHGLIGENGAGKTTFIKIIAGIEQPDPGTRLYFSGKSSKKLSPAKSIALGISVIYQDICLFPNLSISENICIGRSKSHLVNWRKTSDTSRAALEKIGCSDIDIHQSLGNISVGKQQLVALARAVLQNAKIIIMDEPSAALSQTEVQMLIKTIQNLKKESISIIYISHKLDEVLTVADRVSILRDGRKIGTHQVNEVNKTSLIRMMVGRELRFLPMRNNSDIGDKIFEVKGLTRRSQFKDISFSLREHEILGITGLIGAKRSEMAQSLFGLQKIDKGVILMGDKTVTPNNPIDAIKRGICYLPEDRREQGLFLDQLMSHNITVSKIGKILNRCRLINKRRETAITRSYIDRLSIKPGLPDTQTKRMSGGNQQKVLFGRWLNAEPKILIADEPTTGVDVGAKLEIHKLLRKLAQSGVGVILISSDISEVLAVSDRILVMRDGMIVDEISAEDATQEQLITKGLSG